MSPAVYVFDAYGTLFDVHAAVRKHIADVGPDGATLSAIWRDKQLEYSWTRSLMGRHRDFWKLTEDALDFAYSRVPSANCATRDTLLEAYMSLEAYPDVFETLKALKQSGKKLAILSNGTPDMLEAAVRSGGLEDFLDDIISIEDAGIFKPDERVYELVTTRYRVYPEAVSFQSSNRWDIAGATAFGFRTVWVNRTGGMDEYFDLPPVATLSDLNGLVGLD